MTHFKVTSIVSRFRSNMLSLSSRYRMRALTERHLSAIGDSSDCTRLSAQQFTRSRRPSAIGDLLRSVATHFSLEVTSQFRGAQLLALLLLEAYYFIYSLLRISVLDVESTDQGFRACDALFQITVYCLLLQGIFSLDQQRR